MFISLYKKTNLFLLFFLIVVQFQLNCMNKPWKFPPQIAQDEITWLRIVLYECGEFLTVAENPANTLANELKESTLKVISGLKKGGYLHSWREATDQEKSLECGGYMLKNIGLGCLKPSNVQHINLKNYFKETTNPQKEDIVLYHDGQDKRISCHMGIFIEDNHIESKWGRLPYIVGHPLFHVSLLHGKYAIFLTLKKKYANNKTFLINIMDYDCKKEKYKYNSNRRWLEIKYYEALRN